MSYETINIKVKSITPKDKFNIVGRIGCIYKDYITTGISFPIMFEGDGILRTSNVNSIDLKGNEIEITTANSVYVLEKQEEE